MIPSLTDVSLLRRCCAYSCGLFVCSVSSGSIQRRVNIHVIILAVEHEKIDMEFGDAIDIDYFLGGVIGFLAKLIL